MFKLTLKGIYAHKARFALTTFAVVLGVSFVVGSFVLTDSLRKAFDTLFTEVSEGLDVEVRSVAAFDTEEGDREPLPEDTLAVVRGAEGVRVAEGYVEGYAQPVDARGEAVETQGAPNLGVTYPEDETVGPLRLTEGTAPGPGDIVMDRTTAKDNDFVVGRPVTVLLEGGSQEFTLSGIATFGETGNLAGATMVAFDLATAQEVLGQPGFLDAIEVAGEEGVSPDELQKAIAAELPAGVEAVDRQTIIDENTDAVGSFISIFANVLLAFAGIALFVSAFIINNTFAITLGQRVRELALLRALGASRQQVLRMMIGEAIVIGVLATVIGVVLGIIVAVALKSLFNAIGFGLPPAGTVLTPRTFIAAALIGIGVPLLSSLTPARRAALIPPVAAMQDAFVIPGGSPRRRVIIGVVLTVLGGLVLASGLFGDQGTVGTLSSVGGGAILIFLGVARLSTLFARPAAEFIGAPLPVAQGVAGRLAQQNAARNPQRTAATASALMVGLALVGMVLVVGTSIKETFAAQLERSISADFIVTTDSFTSFSPELARRLSELPEISAATGVRGGPFRLDGSTKQLAAADPPALGQLVDLNIREGDLADLDVGGVFVHQDPAEDLALALGDTVTVEFARTGTQKLRVAGIYEDASIVGTWVIGLDTFAENYTEQLDFFVVARRADSATPAQARAAVDKVAADFPQVNVEDRAQFQQGQEAQLDQVLLVVNLLLGLAIVIALLGIATTLALSVFERTRELGLLRAVGMSRRQMRRMVRWEAAVVAVFGALLGVTLGILFGWALTTALPTTIVDRLAIPVGQIVIIVIVAAIAGLLAAFFPARRAARLNVLDAVSHA